MSSTPKNPDPTPADVVVDAAGRGDRRTQTIRADGKDHPTDRAGYAVLARWRDERTLETIGKKDEAIISRGTYKLTEDGGTLTISDGPGDQRIVLQRAHH